MIIEFPRHSQMGASRIQIIGGRCLEFIGKVFNLLSVPGAIKDIDIQDNLSGQNLKIRVGVLFTLISINGRDYYFSRLSGKFGGTGSGRCD